MATSNADALKSVRSLRARLILAREEQNLSTSERAMLDRTIAALKTEHRRLLGVTSDTDYSVVNGRLRDARNDLLEIRDERKRLANTLVGMTSIFNAATKVLALLG